MMADLTEDVSIILNYEPIKEKDGDHDNDDERNFKHRFVPFPSSLSYFKLVKRPSANHFVTLIIIFSVPITAAAIIAILLYRYRRNEIAVFLD